MPGPGAGVLVNGTLDFPCIALLHKAPDLVRAEVRDKHLVIERHNLIPDL